MEGTEPLRGKVEDRVREEEEAEDGGGGLEERESGTSWEEERGIEMEGTALRSPEERADAGVVAGAMTTVSGRDAEEEEEAGGGEEEKFWIAERK